MNERGFYKNAKGVIPWQEGDEPSEVTIRRLRDGNVPQWIFVEQWLPPVGQVVKVTDGQYVIESLVMPSGDWSFTYWTDGRDDARPVIAWLYEPMIELPSPPTIADYEEWLAQRKKG